MTLPATAPALQDGNSGHVANGGFSPVSIMEVELTAPLPALAPTGHSRGIWVLARLHTEPVGVCEAVLPSGGASPDELAALLWDELSDAIAGRLAAAGLAVPPGLTGAGLVSDPAASPFLRRRSRVLADAPFISAVVCTRDRPDHIANLLSRLELVEYPHFEVVIVDNAPTSDDLRDLVGKLSGGKIDFRYCREPRPGLSWARNAGIAAASGDIIAFLDDDDEPDRDWLTSIAAGFVRGERIGCVTGMILPARLDTPAEMLFEQVGGHRKGRGFVPETFSRSGPQSPLFPLPPFGAGANMAFRRDVLDRIGGFDVALGAGTPTHAAEDTLALTLTMLAGYEIAYEPASLMWHHHRQDIAALNRQLHGYSVSLTAYYVALLRHRPGVLPALLGLLPAAIGYMKGTVASSDAPAEPAAELDRRQLQAMLKGPFAYVRSALRQRKAAHYVH